MKIKFGERGREDKFEFTCAVFEVPLKLLKEYVYWQLNIKV